MDTSAVPVVLVPSGPAQEQSCGDWPHMPCPLHSQVAGVCDVCAMSSVASRKAPRYQAMASPLLTIFLWGPKVTNILGCIIPQLELVNTDV